MVNFFEVKDIRRFILESNNWQDFTEILKQEGKKTKGNAFELLSMCYLKTDPFYGSIFKDIFHESEVSTEIKVEKLKLAKNDIGVDLIGLDFDGDYWAIQCKYRSLISRNLRLNDRLAEFFSMTGGQTLKKELKNRILITTTNNVSQKIKDNFSEFSQILNDSFSKLDSYEFSKFKEYLNERYKKIKIKKVLRKPEYQQKAIKSVVRKFRKQDKGQLIMACGSGKTLTALQIKEKLKIKRTLYLLPSLNLINQTIREWVSYSGSYFRPLCVCSDQSSAKVIEKKERWIFSKEDIGIPVLNSPENIHEYIRNEDNYVIFCTYQSSHLISQAQQRGLLKNFDITFCDEAHNCAGNGMKKASLILDEKKIKSVKRLFMTATPLNVDQKIKEKAYEKNIEVLSMDDPHKFGEIFHTLSFRDAVSEEILVPYKIIFEDIKKSESEVLEKIINRKLVKIPEIEYIDAESIACDIAIVKGMKKYKIRKLITFHRLVKFAEYFSKTFNYVWQWMDKKDKSIFPPQCFWLSGEKHSQQYRQTILDKFKHLKNEDSLIVSNSQCLSEGVNVPSLDGICFVDPKRSTNDIIQSVGRVMRTSECKTTGYIIIPIFINDIDQIDVELNKTRYKYIWNIIKALMEHDEYLSETIEKLRIEIGKRKKTTRDRKGLELPKEIIISEELGNTFADSIEVMIARNTTDNWFEKYGELLEYVHQNKHAKVPQKDKNLGVWTNTQRRNYRLGILSKKRINLLEKLIEKGWTWNVYEDKSKEYLRLIEEYLENNGHLIIKGSEKKYYTPADKIRTQYEQNPKSEIYAPIFKRLNQLKKYWMWNPTIDISLEKIRFLKEWCEDNESGAPSREIIHEGSPKTYSHQYKKTKFNLGSKANEYRSRYRYMRFGYHPEYKGEFEKDTVDRRHLTEKEIKALNNIKFWYWETWEGYVRVYKKCFLKGINIVATTNVDFDAKEIRKIGNWVSRMRSKALKGKLKTHIIITLESLPNWTYEPDHDAFMNGIKEFIKYTENKEDKDIPQETISKSGFKLGAWVSDVRGRYKKRRRLSKIKIYSDLYKNLLDDNGFLWVGNDLRGNNIKIKISENN